MRIFGRRRPIKQVPRADAIYNNGESDSTNSLYLSSRINNLRAGLSALKLSRRTSYKFSVRNTKR